MDTKFKPGDRVRKVGGSYQAVGEIKAAFLADDGTSRYVFRFDDPAGMLHIFGDANLESMTGTASDEYPPMCPNCVTPWKCNGPHTL